MDIHREEPDVQNGGERGHLCPKNKNHRLQERRSGRSWQEVGSLEVGGVVLS